MSYSNWNQGEPNDVSEGCMEMIHQADDSYEWNDISCETQLCAVCELDAGK